MTEQSELSGLNERLRLAKEGRDEVRALSLATTDWENKDGDGWTGRPENLQEALLFQLRGLWWAT